MARIVIYAMNYAPEFAGVGRYSGEIGRHLAASGHDVTVVTTAPHYPGWRIAAPYRNGRYRVDFDAGVRIIRCPLVLREKMSGLWRLIAPLSFALASAPVAFWQILRRRPDVVLCIEPTLLVAPIAALAARLSGARTALHVQDLEVDAAFAVGHLRDRFWLRKIAHGFENAMLRRFDRFVTISHKMAERLVGKGVAADRIAIVRNWVDLDSIRPLRGISPYRGELGLAERDFVVLYSGNIGMKQGLDSLIGAIRALRDRDEIQFVIAGEGPAKADLVADLANEANLRILPFQPEARLSEFLGVADLHVLPQQAGAADLVLPSKLGGMLASGRRIVVTAAAGTELALFLADAAIVVAPDDPAALAEAIARAADDRRDVDVSGRRRRLAGLLSKPDALRRIEAAILGTDFAPPGAMEAVQAPLGAP